MKTSNADLRDVASIDAIIAAAYDVISGPAGRRRDWNRERSLFFPRALIIPTAKAQSPERISNHFPFFPWPRVLQAEERRVVKNSSLCTKSTKRTCRKFHWQML